MRKMTVFLASLLAITALAGSLHIEIAAKLLPPKAGKNTLEVRLRNHEGKPLTGATVSATVTMAGMDHKVSASLREKGDGLYAADLTLPMEGTWNIAVAVKAGEEAGEKSFSLHSSGAGGAEHGQHGQRDAMGHDMPGMKGRLGDWSTSREGSGTSWMPDASPMFMKSLGTFNGFDVHLMGLATVNYADAGGERGESQVFSNSMAMLMGRRDLGAGILGFSFMASLDPLFNGKKGYPNLFQTGETADGAPLKDRQHPHDLFAEIAATYSHPLGSNARWFVYGGPVGEPALGGPMYLHRPSGMENPEAPISHHWFDSSHITFGVLTAGLNFGNKWQVEASYFNGREPDEDRYDFDTIKLDSGSGRVTFNPNENLSFQVSYGFLKEPETLEPGVDQHRLTASAMFSRPLANGGHVAATAFFGQNIKEDDRTSAFGIEATYFHRRTSFFGRFERVEKDELVDVPAGVYAINKLTFGATHDFAQTGGFDLGLGGFIGLYSFPDSLEPFYGRNPVSFGIFLRVRPSRMSSSMEGMNHRMVISSLGNNRGR